MFNLIYGYEDDYGYSKAYQLINYSRSICINSILKKSLTFLFKLEFATYNNATDIYL